MPGVGHALVSTPSLCCYRILQSIPETSLRSHPFVSASSVQLIRSQRKCSQLLPVISCSSHSGIIPRFLAKVGQASSFSSCPLLLEKSGHKEGVEGEPSSSSRFLREEPGGFVSKATAESFSLYWKQSALLRHLGVWGIGSFVLSSAGAALAEIIEVPATKEGAQPTDYLLSFLFISAFIGLAILTIGVIYLSVSDFLENRQRTAMQKAAGEEKGKTEKTETKVGTPKGFGVPKVEKKTEKSK